MLLSSPSWISSSQHAPAEVRPAPPAGHAHHDAPSHGSGTTYCSTKPRLLCPVLHLQPTAVHQSATGPADDSLPVTGKIYSSHQHHSVLKTAGCNHPGYSGNITGAGTLHLSQLFTRQTFACQMPAVQQLDREPA